jgi:hypothetical protein
MKKIYYEGKPFHFELHCPKAQNLLNKIYVNALVFKDKPNDWYIEKDEKISHLEDKYRAKHYILLDDNYVDLFTTLTKYIFLAS